MAFRNITEKPKFALDYTVIVKPGIMGIPLFLAFEEKEAGGILISRKARPTK